MSVNLGPTSDFLINSALRDSGTIQNFNKTLKRNSVTEDSCVIKSCTIPKTWDNITTDCNTFTAGGSTITLTIGRYLSPSLLITEVLTKLGGDYTMTYNTVTGRFTFDYTGAGSSSFVIPDTWIQTAFGLPADTYLLPVESVNKVDLVRVKYIMIHSSSIYNYGTFDQSSDMLMSVPADLCENYIINEIGVEAKFLTSRYNNTLNFRLYDQSFRPLDLNGCDYSMNIMLFKNNNHDEIALQSLELDHLEKIVK